MNLFEKLHYFKKLPKQIRFLYSKLQIYNFGNFTVANLSDITYHRLPYQSNYIQSVMHFSFQYFPQFVFQHFQLSQYNESNSKQEGN